MTEPLLIECSEWRAEVEIHPREMEVIMEMLIEAEADICRD